MFDHMELEQLREIRDICKKLNMKGAVINLIFQLLIHFTVYFVTSLLLLLFVVFEIYQVILNFFIKLFMS